jgi:hypothetical protein
MAFIESAEICIRYAPVAFLPAVTSGPDSAPEVIIDLSPYNAAICALLAAEPARFPTSSVAAATGAGGGGVSGILGDDIHMM